jgi:signal peptidase
MSSIRGIVKDIIIVAICVTVIWIGLTVYFGAQNPFYVVSSGSMYPELAMYDIIVISGHTSFEDVRIGDIIVFDRPKDHDKVIVHRVVAVVDDDPKTLRTKGDNNQRSIVGTDYPITEEEYTGKVIHVIPQVGFITKILQPPINYIIIAVIVGVMIIRQVYRKDKKKLIDQAKAESSTSDYNEFQSNEKTDQPTRDFDSIYSAQEKKSTDKLDEENTKSEGVPEFFLDKEKESEENKE